MYEADDQTHGGTSIGRQTGGEFGWFRVTFVSPSGFVYEVTCQAQDASSAVSRTASELEWERVNLPAHLAADGVTALPPARLGVETLNASEAALNPRLVVTGPHGSVRRS